LVPCPRSLQGVSCRKITESSAHTPCDRNPGISVFPGGDGAHPLGLEFKQESLAHAWPNSRTPIDPVTLGLTSLYPHAIVPSLLSDEGKRIVLPAFFQRGRDLPDKTRQTLATAHRGGPTHRGRWDPLFSLRENAIAKEPGPGYPERWRCVSRLGLFNGGLDSFESSPYGALSRGAFSAPSLVTRPRDPVPGSYGSRLQP
jgi:hypothetical protein